MSKENPVRGRDIVNNPDRFVRDSVESTSGMMTQTVSITLGSPSGYYLLTDPPEGVSVISLPPSQKKSFGPIDVATVDFVVNFAINFDINPVVDRAFQAWVLLKVGSLVRSMNGNRSIELHSSSEENPTTIDAVVNKIESKKDENGDC